MAEFFILMIGKSHGYVDGFHGFSKESREITLQNGISNMANIITSVH